MEHVESGRLDTMITLYTQTENYVSTARTINFEYIEPPAKFTMISVTSADGTTEESQQNIKESSSNYGFSKNMIA
ncbi:MAG: hypothetical protein Q8Q47_02850 [Ignavibacteriaceae bacterium]|nr:hypothetical protein [Ignavibacteriaceae bacterium]